MPFQKTRSAQNVRAATITRLSRRDLPARRCRRASRSKPWGGQWSSGPIRKRMACPRLVTRQLAEIVAHGCGKGRLGASPDRLDDHRQDAALGGRDVLEAAGQARQVRSGTGRRRGQDQPPSLHLALGPVAAPAREHGVSDVVGSRVADDLEVDARRPNDVDRNHRAAQAEAEFGFDPGDGRGKRFARDRAHPPGRPRNSRRRP